MERVRKNRVNRWRENIIWIVKSLLSQFKRNKTTQQRPIQTQSEREKEVGHKDWTIQRQTWQQREGRRCQFCPQKLGDRQTFSAPL